MAGSLTDGHHTTMSPTALRPASSSGTSALLLAEKVLLVLQQLHRAPLQLLLLQARAATDSWPVVAPGPRTKAARTSS